MTNPEGQIVNFFKEKLKFQATQAQSILHPISRQQECLGQVSCRAVPTTCARYKYSLGRGEQLEKEKNF